jgi:hypothetical protein
MMESLVIAGACILTILAVSWLQLRLIAGILTQKVAELDQNLANAIQMTIEANNPAKVIARDEKGLFTAESETESN